MSLTDFDVEILTKKQFIRLYAGFAATFTNEEDDKIVSRVLFSKYSSSICEKCGRRIEVKELGIHDCRDPLFGEDGIPRTSKVIEIARDIGVNYFRYKEYAKSFVKERDTK